MAIKLSDLQQHTTDIQDLKKRQKLFEIINMGIIFVLFLAFVGVVYAVDAILIDSNRAKEDSYSSLVDTIKDQNFNIKLLMQKNHIPWE